MKFTKLRFLFLACAMIGFHFANRCKAQTFLSKINFSGYLETYFNFDLNNPSSNRRPSFMYSHNRHNEVNINLALLKASVTDSSWRVNLALMAGTYSSANLSNEPVALRNLFEANAGLKISKNKNIWLDAGILPSHIGFESAIGKDCWALSRCILSDNSPYFESGVRISSTSANEKWYLSALALNGWQRIQRLRGNSLPSFGTQVTYKPTVRLTINSSSFVGTDSPDTSRVYRYFHNFYFTFLTGARLGFTFGLDAGAEQKTKNSRAFNYWGGMVLMTRLILNSKWALVARAEYFYDPEGVIITANSPNGFRTFGYSMNLEYAFRANILWRTEARGLSSKDRIFQMNGNASAQNYCFSTAFAVSF